MKRIICLITILCLVLGSFSFCFATPVDWDSSDSQHLTEIRNTLVSGGIYNLINAINSNVVQLNSNLVQLMTWLDPSSGNTTSAILNQILNALVYTNAGGAAISYLTDLRQENQIQSNYLQSIRLYTQGVYNMFVDTFPLYYFTLSGYGGLAAGTPSSTGSFAQLVQDRLTQIIQTLSFVYAYEYQYLATGCNSQQALVSFADPDSTVTFTPVSVADGIYKYLNAINTPLARLGYVLASDSRIEAQDAAAANEQAVVDNFIDSTGNGSASPSDIGSISDLSSGYKSNFGSDASVTGIFNIFNSNNMGWFSQETANQLDTTTPTRRGSSFETPLLDQQIEDIYDQIGVKHD